MALTFRRWIVLAVAGALITAAYFLTERPQPARELEPRQLLDRRVNSTHRAASRAADRLRVLQLRDSVLASLARAPRTDSSRTLFGAGLPPSVQLGLAVAAKHARSGIPSQARLPIDLVFVLDAGAVVRGINRGYGVLTADYILPRSASERCLVLARYRPPRAEGLAHSDRARVTSISQITARRLLGPCAFFGAFGFPGQQVDRWLLDGGWSYGITADWTRNFPRWQPPPWSRTQGFLESASGWPLRSYVSAPGYRCISGDAEKCRDVLVNGLPGGQIQRYPETWGNRIVSGGGLGWNLWRRAELGPNQGALLAEAARTIGAERFRQFWASDVPVDDAFRAATGQGIGEWTHTWATSAYGADLGRGPAVPPVGAAIALSLVALALGASMWAARRRQVT